MTIVTFQNLTVEFGERAILKGLSGACPEQAVIGMIGSNGAGKSTLLNVLSGQLAPTDGTVSFHPKTRTGYLRQNSGLSGSRSIIEELRYVAHEGLEAIERLSQTTDPKEYARLQALIDATDAYQIDVRIQKVLSGMGFSGRDLSMRVDALSGGEMTRLALCKLLVEQPNLLLLDEPTNHLDFKTLNWLERYLNTYKGTVIVVSHDRFFLDRAATEIWELEAGALRCYTGNYSAYKEQKAQTLKEQTRLYEQQEKEVAKLTAYIDKNLARASTAAMAKSRRNQLERMERIQKPGAVLRKLTLKFPLDQPGGNDVLQCRDLAVEVGEGHRLFSALSFRMQKGEKIAIVGDNGTGKSSLLLALMGELLPVAGTVRWGANIQRGFFRQAIDFEDGNRSVLEELGNRFPLLSYQQLRAALAMVSFLGDEAELKVGSLSGGERARLQFSLLMLERCNTLLMDEPTNHLDLPAREEVERSLTRFEGNLLVVSHDRYFLSHVPTKIYKLTPQGLAPLRSLEDYWAEEPKSEASKPVAKKETSGGYQNRQERARAAQHRQQITRLERELQEGEAQIAALHEQMGAGAIDYKELEESCLELEKLKKQQDEKTEEWMALAESDT